MKYLKDVFLLLIAQELVNDWLDTKLKQELTSDGEGDAESTVFSVTPTEEARSHWKYDKFDGKNVSDCSKLHHLMNGSKKCF